MRFGECGICDTGKNSGNVCRCDERAQSDKNLLVMMPRSLTAENGAKALLSGEFKVEEEIQCPECEGYGYHMHPPDNEKIECELCKGATTVIERHSIPWTTIKKIYAMAVKHLAS